MTVEFDKGFLDPLYRYAYSLTGEPDGAYDLLQSALEKYLKVTKNQEQHQEQQQEQTLNQPDKRQTVKTPAAYVRGIIRNLFIDQVRHQQVLKFELYDEAMMGALECQDLESLALHQIQLESIWEALESYEREILYFWAVLGFSAEEISVETGQPRGTILSRLHRMRKKLLKTASVDSVSLTSSTTPSSTSSSSSSIHVSTNNDKNHELNKGGDDV